MNINWAIPSKKGSWRNFTYLDGLGNDWINATYRTIDGMMWFGTGFNTGPEGGGVIRYDGEEFENIKIDGVSVVTDIHQCLEGIIWFSGTGIARYDGHTFETVAGKEQLDGW